MRFCVLGPLEAHANERSVAVGGGRQRAMLALLLVHAGEIVSRDRLIAELWAGQPPPGGSQSLDVYISRLRKAFRAAGANDVLATRSPGYVLHAGETDARRFDRLVTQAETLQPADPAAAQDIWARADHLAVSQAAWVPLANTGSADLLSRRGGNFTLDANSNPQIDQLWMRVRNSRRACGSRQASASNHQRLTVRTVGTLPAGNGDLQPPHSRSQDLGPGRQTGGGGRCHRRIRAYASAVTALAAHLQVAGKIPLTFSTFG